MHHDQGPLKEILLRVLLRTDALSPGRLGSHGLVFASSALLASCIAGCGSNDSAGNGNSGRRPHAQATAPMVPRPPLCSRTADDPVRDVFCKTETSIASLGALQDALKVPYDTHVRVDPAFMGHSTSLSGRVVSPINPRVIIDIYDSAHTADRVLLAFQRGAQHVEMAAWSPTGGTFDFYLLTFTQACNAAPGGCSPGDLYTPAIESDWAGVELQDDEDLKNTPLDCRQCHQRGREAPVLLMRELQSPWMHFFEGPPSALMYLPSLDQSGGMALESTYERAKGDEPYANFVLQAIQNSSGSGLQGAVDPDQPLRFDSLTILAERFPYTAPAGSPPERSKTWDREYETFKLGDHLALPYFAPNPTDPDKLAALTTAYQDYRAGSIAAVDLPDLADIFPDDPHGRAQIGLQTEPDATPAEALIQACAPCHNDVLDQDISRARFNVALSRLDAAELDAAVDRLGRATDDPAVMPPSTARQLDDATRERVIEYLRAGDFAQGDLGLLSHAATAGMAGKAR